MILFVCRLSTEGHRICDGDVLLILVNLSPFEDTEINPEWVQKNLLEHTWANFQVFQTERGADNSF